jgi:hypothetical protein
MVDIDDSFSINIADGVNTNDLLNNPDKHYWKIGFKFPNEARDPFATPTGRKYGRNVSFKALYRALHTNFIEQYFAEDYYDSWVKEAGDELLLELNEEIGITVNKLKSETDKVYSMTRNARINKTRKDNATQRYEDYRERYASELIGLDDLAENIPLTRKGKYDRRTRAFHKYALKVSKLSEMEKTLSKLEKRALTEQVRYENSVERARLATDNIRKIHSGEWRSLKDKYREKARTFAEYVKDDIIDRGMTGSLPVQNLPLKESTIRKRLGVGLNATPRFWATGQLIRSIQITCTII